jgi:hypothetical protein
MAWIHGAVVLLDGTAQKIALIFLFKSVSSGLTSIPDASSIAVAVNVLFAVKNSVSVKFITSSPTKQFSQNHLQIFGRTLSKEADLQSVSTSPLDSDLRV